ncbi:MAG TPA: ABC transporter permease subunit [Mycobacteriales bacterium]|nr:ABC transporter permease subunit [Mycobacteriales bacterium]
MTGDTEGGRGFGRLLHAEWTKFRTVRGWVLGMAAAAGLIMAFGLSPGVQGSCGRHGPGSECVPLIGPGGQEVTDSFFFVHQPLAGDGSVTVRVTSLTGQLPPERPGGSWTPHLPPWAKAGLIIKDGTRLGSSYAAVMVTGGRGVRMQDDYTHDRAGQPGAATAAAPRWLRLTRTGQTVTGAESTDGTHWTTVGTATLPQLPPTAQVGLFVTAPPYAAPIGGLLGAASSRGSPTLATATFDRLDRSGGGPDQAWTGSRIGGPDNAPADERGGYAQTGDQFSITGSGDIGPSVAGAAGIGVTITQTLAGTFIGLIAVVVVGALFVTAEFRRGLIRTTLSASPARGRILAAKAVVVGAVGFLTGLVAAAVVVTAGQRLLRHNGAYVHVATTGTELRVVVGTAALVATAAVLAVGLGAVLRNSAAAVSTAIVVIVLPYLLVVTALPVGAAQWLLRVSPAAAFALQQSARQYPQVANLYRPADGYFPLAPWAGFAVLGGWTAATLALAALLLRRRDA